MFINRQTELALLDKRQKAKEAELLAIYGRRRVGKTELIRQSLKKHTHIYFLADKQSELEQLRNFSLALGQYFNDSVIIDQPLGSWDLAFRYLSQKLDDASKLILVLDEFPYLVDANPALPSILQKYWDTEWKGRNIFIILCGSSVSFMEREVLSYKNPLYGRFTGQIKLEPFGFRESAKFFPSRDHWWAFDIYSVFGGRPAYLQQVSSEADVYENVAELVLPKDKILFNEINLVLRQELREPRTYFYILRAIAFGRTQLNEIVHYTGLERALVAKYLDVLIGLGLVERAVPITEKNPERSRKGRYQMSNSFFRFWFRFIYPNLSFLEVGRKAYVSRIIRRDLSTFQGLCFESIVKEMVWEESADGRLLLHLEKLGGWWDSKEEIDMVGINGDEKSLLIGECKTGEVRKGQLDKLKKLWGPLQSITGARRAHYVLVSKSGFDADLMRLKGHGGDVSLYLLDKTGWQQVK